MDQPVDEGGEEPQDMVKIGEVAKLLGISIRTIHMYEREGLFISHKNMAGTRYFSQEDIRWLQEVRRMIKSSISIAGIRALMSLIPCWEIRRCDYHSRTHCPAITDHSAPCWSNVNNLCEESGQQCRRCEVYQLRFKAGSLKNIMDIKPKDGG
ncbi:MAG: MerR family transcriptional regulator [Magnetococcales bacterium]|nr:MerR family transcriptional regulator [Magnetococcales bacterium]